MSDPATVTASASVRTLAEFFPLYRARNPILDEHVQLTLLGLPEGAPRRRVQRMGVAVIILAVAGALIGEAVGLFLVLTLVGSALGVIVGVAFVPSRDLALGVILTDKRAAIAQQRRHGEPHVIAVLPPSSLTSVRVDANADRFWFSGKLTRLTLAGPEGLVAALDLVGFDVGAATAVLHEAGIEVDDQHLASSVEPTRIITRTTNGRLWFPRAFIVGLLYFLGACFVLLAVPVGLEDGVWSALAGLAVAAGLLATGEGLRRLLFRKTRE